MHTIAVNAEVNFHEQEVVSIFHETNVADVEELFAELVFAAAFAIRSMSNLGPHPCTDALGDSLQLIGQLIVGAPNEVLRAKPKLIAYPGHPGRKCFLGALRLSASQMELSYTPKGFGWLSTGIWYYCPMAVQAVFRYFAHRRSADDKYLSALASVAAGCGALQSAQQITLMNHAQLVATLMANCMEDYTPEWLA